MSGLFGRSIQGFKGVRYSGGQLRLRVGQRGNVLALFSELGNAPHQIGECLCGIMGNLTGTGDLLRGGLHRQHGRANLITDTLHRGGNTFGRVGTFHSKGADLISHHGKSRPFFTGS
jgi:hypothetical protein